MLRAAARLSKRASGGSFERNFEIPVHTRAFNARTDFPESSSASRLAADPVAGTRLAFGAASEASHAQGVIGAYFQNI